MSPALIVLFLALAIATVTDLRRGVIPNAVTYSGILACLLAWTWVAGVEGLWFATAGLLACGGLLLAGYLLADISGGDVKLGAMLGAGLGWADGLYALLWTFTLAACVVLAMSIFRHGAVSLFRDGLRSLRRQPVTFEATTTPENVQFQYALRLAPAALVATWIVVYT